MDEKIEWKPGVYLKPNSKLLLLEEYSKDNFEYELFDGKKATSKQAPLWVFILGELPLLSMTFNKGYWANKFLSKCEYLGEL